MLKIFVFIINCISVVLASDSLPFKNIENEFKKQISQLEHAQNVYTQCSWLATEYTPCFYSVGQYMKELAKYENDNSLELNCKKLCSKKVTIEEIQAVLNENTKNLKKDYKTQCDIYPINGLKLTSIFNLKNKSNLQILEHRIDPVFNINIYVVTGERYRIFSDKIIIYTNKDDKVYEVVKLSTYINQNSEYSDFESNLLKSIKEKYINISNIKHTEQERSAKGKDAIYNIDKSIEEFYVSLLNIPTKKKLSESEQIKRYMNKDLTSYDDEYINFSSENTILSVNNIFFMNTFENDYNFIQVRKGLRNFAIIRYVNKELLTSLLNEKQNNEDIHSKTVEETIKDKIKQGL